MRVALGTSLRDALPLFEGKDAVDPGKLDLFNNIPGPVDFHAIDRRRIANAKVDPLIVGRSVTSPAQHVAALLHAVCRQVDRGANRIARALRATHQLELDPVMMVVVHIAQQDGRPVHHIDHDIDLAVVEEVAESAAASGDDVGKPGAFDRRHVLKLLPLQVPKEQRTLRKARAPIVLVYLRIDMAIDKKQVLPAVIVVVEKSIAPAKKRNRDLRDPRPYS